MSEEKLYAVKNDEGEWLSFDGMQTEIWYSNNPTLFKDKSYAEAQNMGRRAHVVALIEEPEKVVLTKEQAEIVDDARGFYLPASFISSKSDDEEDEELLMKAYVNGYTVAKEKKYNVKVPGRFAGGDRFYCKLHEEFSETAQLLDGDPRFMLTMAEIEQLGLTRCERVEVTDDDD